MYLVKLACPTSAGLLGGGNIPHVLPLGPRLSLNETRERHPFNWQLGLTPPPWYQGA